MGQKVQHGSSSIRLVKDSLRDPADAAAFVDQAMTRYNIRYSRAGVHPRCKGDVESGSGVAK